MGSEDSSRTTGEYITSKEIEQLRLSIIDVLNRAIEAGGTTIRSYLNALGESGGFQVALHVYQQTGKPCIRCGTPIVKIKVAQRGTQLLSELSKAENRKVGFVLGLTGGIATGKVRQPKSFSLMDFL